MMNTTSVATQVAVPVASLQVEIGNREHTIEARKRAIENMYEAYAEQIYKFVYFKLGNREDAEDVTSQVFLKAAVALDVSQDPRSMLAWLYQVARTSVSDFWRRYYKTLASS